MRPRNLLLVTAILLAMLGAFLAGIYVAGIDTSAKRGPTAVGSVTGQRDMYSPRVLDDPNFLEQQKEGLAALEAQCRETGEYCSEARQIRQWLEQQAVAR